MSVVARLAFGGAFFLSLLEMMVLGINLLSISSSNFRNAFLLLREKSPGDLICRRRKFPASAASGLCFMSSVSGFCVGRVVVLAWCRVVLVAFFWLDCCLLTELMSSRGLHAVLRCLVSRCPSSVRDPVWARRDPMWVGLLVGVSLRGCPRSWLTCGRGSAVSSVVLNIVNLIL